MEYYNKEKEDKKMTLISVLGDFDSSILPVFYQFQKQIKKHIIIYDDFKCDVKGAKRLIRGIKNFCKKEKLNIKTIVHCIDEDSYEAIIKTIELINDNTKNTSKLLINTTDGLSNVNILIANHFLPQGAKILSYDRYDNHCNVITKDSMETYFIDKTIPIKDHFFLKDIKIDSIGSKKFAKKYHHQIVSIFENYKEEFKEFANYVQVENDPSLKNKRYQNINSLINQMGIDNLKQSQTLITGGLFEYYIYLKVKDTLKYDDIQIAVQVKQYTDGRNFIPNEFDILIMRNNHLHMIECKYTNRIKLENLVYKYMALKHIIDDDGKIIMVTAHNELEPKIQTQNPLDNLPYKRAKENKMLLLGDPLQDINRFLKVVKEFLEV